MRTLDVWIRSDAFSICACTRPSRDSSSSVVTSHSASRLGAVSGSVLLPLRRDCISCVANVATDISEVAKLISSSRYLHFALVCPSFSSMGSGVASSPALKNAVGASTDPPPLKLAWPLPRLMRPAAVPPLPAMRPIPCCCDARAPLPKLWRAFVERREDPKPVESRPIPAATLMVLAQPISSTWVLTRFHRAMRRRFTAKPSMASAVSGTRCAACWNVLRDRLSSSVKVTVRTVAVRRVFMAMAISPIIAPSPR
mmetsp:Transcript_5215/g.13262  ORF Transcript_5215/g.13262 Transcript_5215/m.13262 type:complete len:255 (-) Transcript_5215:1519-2283(-)